MDIRSVGAVVKRSFTDEQYTRLCGHGTRKQSCLECSDQSHSRQMLHSLSIMIRRSKGDVHTGSFVKNNNLGIFD